MNAPRGNARYNIAAPSSRSKKGTSSKSLSPLPLAPSTMGVQIVANVRVDSDKNLLQERDNILECLRPLLIEEEQKQGYLGKIEADVSLSSFLGVDRKPARAQYHHLYDFQQQEPEPNKKRRRSSSKVAAAASGEYLESSEVDLTEHQENLWQKRFKELREFQTRHGHCLVRFNWSENIALAKWVKRQRYQYKLKLASKRSTLTDDRQNALDNLGFVWDLHKAVWEDRLSELLEYKLRHGHCNVPSKYRDNHSLSVWVQVQRRQYKLFQENDERSYMTRERVDRLEAVGFVWKPR